LQNCYFDHKDWTKCRKEMHDFKECFQRHQKS
jgi:hypothetical protein